MNFQQLDTWADEAQTRYAQLCLNWSAIYRNTLMAPKFGQASVVVNATAEAREVADRYLVRERPLIEAAISAASKEAHTALQADLQVVTHEDHRTLLDAHLKNSAHYLIEELHAQVTRDIVLLRKSMMVAAFATQMAMRSRGLTQRAAIIEYQVGETKPLAFVFRDKIGRATNAAAFARMLWRQTVHGVINETVIWGLINAGYVSAGIYKQVDGIVTKIDAITLTGQRDMPNYGDIRGIVFHPNSTAYIGRDWTYVSA